MDESSVESPPEHHDEKEQEVAWGLLGIRSGVGGVLMGLANLVPGISGGTMLLASGVYPRFINAVAEVSTFRFQKVSVFVLGIVVGMAGLVFVGCAGPIKGLVSDYRWVMYSLFIGLTFGGLPLVWRMARPIGRNTWIGAVIGFGIMVGLAVMQQMVKGGDEQSSFLLMIVAGMAGASAMILPGVSGAYLLLVLGVYLPVLGAIESFVDAAKAVDMEAAWEPAVNVLLPLGIGVVVGVVTVSNGLKLMLEKCRNVTLGGLLGLLVGAVVGLWPFQKGVPPKAGDVIRGKVLTTEEAAEMSADKWPTEFFTPDVMQVVWVLVLIGVGLLVTGLLAKIGGDNGGKSV